MEISSRNVVLTNKPYDSSYKFIDSVNKNCDKIRETTGIQKAKTNKQVILPLTLTRFSTNDSIKTVYNPISGNINNLFPKKEEDNKQGCAIM